MKSIEKKLKGMWERFRKGMFQILSANVINKFVAVLSNMVITRVLSTSDYGTWSYVLNLYTYFSIISALGLLNGAFQFGAENREKDKEFAYYKYCLKSGLFINLSLVGISTVGTVFFKPALPGTEKYLLSYIPVLLLEYVMNILTTVLRCENRIKEYAKVLNINTILIALGTCGGAFWGIKGVIAGKYFAYAVSLVVLIVLMKHEIMLIHTNGETLYKGELKELWHFSVMSCISSAMNSLLYLIDVSMITSLMKDAEQTAIYKVATLAPNALSFIPSSVVVYILPNLIAHNRDNKWLKTHVRKYYSCMGLTNIMITAAVVLFAPLIIRVLSGSKYLAAVPLFRILMIGYAISATFRTLSSNILFGLKKVNINMVINIVAGGVDILLNYCLINKHGAFGAAAATVLSETLASIIAFSYVLWTIYYKRQGSINEQDHKRNS